VNGPFTSISVLSLRRPFMSQRLERQTPLMIWFCSILGFSHISSISHPAPPSPWGHTETPIQCVQLYILHIYNS
jgi:hypothetical protein